MAEANADLEAQVLGRLYKNPARTSQTKSSGTCRSGSYWRLRVGVVLAHDRVGQCGAGGHGVGAGIIERDVAQVGCLSVLVQPVANGGPAEL